MLSYKLEKFEGPLDLLPMSNTTGSFIGSFTGSFIGSFTGSFCTIINIFFAFITFLLILLRVYNANP